MKAQRPGRRFRPKRYKREWMRRDRARRKTERFREVKLNLPVELAQVFDDMRGKGQSLADCITGLLEWTVKGDGTKLVRIDELPAERIGRNWAYM